MTINFADVASKPMAEVERRLGVTPIEELLAERSGLVEQVADLRAEHGSFGTFEARRKAELARIAQAIRARYHRDGVKATEGAVDDAAHASPEYYDLVVAATQARANLYRLEARIDAIDQTIQRANAIARYLTSEARL